MTGDGSLGYDATARLCRQLVFDWLELCAGLRDSGSSELGPGYVWDQYRGWSLSTLASLW